MVSLVHRMAAILPRTTDTPVPGLSPVGRRAPCRVPPARPRRTRHAQGVPRPGVADAEVEMFSGSANLRAAPPSPYV
jgi:hypothetical protein